VENPQAAGTELGSSNNYTQEDVSYWDMGQSQSTEASDASGGPLETEQNAIGRMAAITGKATSQLPCKRHLGVVDRP
jgi:hypothetical protein